MDGFSWKEMVRSVSVLWYYFEFEQDADELFEFLNSQHPCFKFTFQKQKDDKLAFLLDVITLQTD